MWPLKPPILSTKLLQNRKKPNVIVQEKLILIASFKTVNNKILKHVLKIRTVYFQKKVRVINHQKWFISTKKEWKKMKKQKNENTVKFLASVSYSKAL